MKNNHPCGVESLVIWNAGLILSFIRIEAERNEKTEYTGNQVGIDVGLASFYTDSNGHKVDNPCAIAPRFANAFYENLKDNSSAYRSGCLDDIAILERERKARRCLKPKRNKLSAFIKQEKK